MVDTLEFIDDLTELQELYRQGDLREIDFALAIQKYTKRVEQFEKDMQAEQDQMDLFFKDTPFAYNPTREVQYGQAKQVQTLAN